ncbi:hypothetical protein ADUPG1_011389, partial [Aduncisulcus paluster]
GDILMECEDGSQSNEDWVLVERLDNPRESGYVPRSYVTPISEDEATGVKRDIAGSTMHDTLHPSALGTSTIRPTSSEFHGKEGQSPGDDSPLGTAAFDSTAAPEVGEPLDTTSLPSSFADMFHRHDAYFRQVVKQREESFRRLETSLNAAAQEISVCQEKNTKLTQRIVELDNLIDEERRKWRERLDAEKKSLFSGIGTK